MARTALHDGGLGLHSNAAEVVLPVISRGRYDESLLGSVVVLGEPKAERDGPRRVLFFRSSADEECLLRDARVR